MTSTFDGGVGYEVPALSYFKFKVTNFVPDDSDIVVPLVFHPLSASLEYSLPSYEYCNIAKYCVFGVMFTVADVVPSGTGIGNLSVNI